MGADTFGWKEADRLLASLADRVDKASRQSVVDGGRILREQVKANASSGRHRRGAPHVPGTGPGPNVMSGNLRRAVKSRTPSKKNGVWSARTGVTVQAPYAYRIEELYPYFRRALDETRDRIGKAMVDAWAKVLR